jgi:hypothetical protein
MISCQKFLISRAKFPYFLIFSVSVLGRLRVKGTSISITSAVFILSIDEHYIRSAEIYCFICFLFFKMLLWMLLSIFSMKRVSPSHWVVFALVNVAVCVHYLNVHFKQPFTMCWWSLLRAVLLSSEKLADRVTYCLTARTWFSTSPYSNWAVVSCMTGACLLSTL